MSYLENRGNREHIQWFLLKFQRINPCPVGGTEEADGAHRAHSLEGMVMGKVVVIMDSKIRMPEKDLPEEVLEVLRQRLTFRNPLWEKNRREGRPNHGVERFLRCIWTEHDSGHVVIPKGYLSSLIRLFHKFRVDFELRDETLSFGEEGLFAQVLFQGTAGMDRPFYWEGLDRIMENRFGILVGPPGSGKRMLACKVAGKRGVPALVICSTKRAMYAWKEVAMRHLGLEETEIGLIGDGRKDLGRAFTVAITFSLWKIFREVEETIGFVVVDQCDTANLKVCFKVGMMRAPYILGLATAPRRKGGLTGLMNAYLGPRLYQIYPDDVYDEDTRPVVRVRATGFDYDNPEDWEGLLRALGESKARNSLIAKDVLELCADSSIKAIVLSNRLEHLEALKRVLAEAYGRTEIICGQTAKGDRERILSRFERGALQILLLSFRAVSSFDSKKVSALFVTAPVRFEDHLTQAVGLLLRRHNGHRQRPMIYEYRDKPQVLQASLKRRLKIYRTMGAR